MGDVTREKVEKALDVMLNAYTRDGILRQTKLLPIARAEVLSLFDAAIRQAREECAKVCDSAAGGPRGFVHPLAAAMALECAASIRALAKGAG